LSFSVVSFCKYVIHITFARIEGIKTSPYREVLPARTPHRLGNSPSLLTRAITLAFERRHDPPSTWLTCLGNLSATSWPRRLPVSPGAAVEVEVEEESAAPEVELEVDLVKITLPYRR
jgi:hypothetical protein